MVVTDDTFTLMGKALFNAQKVEYILYGIASHLSHLDEAKKDTIFSQITAKDFLSDDPEKQHLRKATLGRLYHLFGKKLLLSNQAFDTFLSERNFIVHNFFRSLSRENSIDSHHKRLNDFIELAELTEKALRGLLSELTEAAATKEGRSKEFQLTADDKTNRKYYKAFIALNMLADQGIDIKKWHMLKSSH